MKKILLFVMCAFLLSSCNIQLIVGRRAKERYYELYPGKRLFKKNRGCDMYPRPIIKGPKIRYR